MLKVSDDGSVKTVPITIGQLEAIVRVAEGVAKMTLERVLYQTVQGRDARFGERARDIGRRGRTHAAGEERSAANRSRDQEKVGYRVDGEREKTLPVRAQLISS